MGAAEDHFRRAHFSATKGRLTALYSRPSFPGSFPRSTLPDSLLPTSEIWNGAQIGTGDEREVMDGPPEGSEVSDLTPIPAMYAPGVNAEDIAEIVERMGN